MKNLIIVTGGAGFIGSNLIELLLKKTSKTIISLDNYSVGCKNNHITNKRIKYFKGDTVNFCKIFNKIRNKIDVVFHFGEFSRIAQSFKNLEECFDSNLKGSYEVINFCLKNKIKIVYSATSASLGNNQNDQHLSPYAFTKSFNMNLIVNLNKWFKLNYEIIYFFNVYGPKQIKKSSMSAVIGIFEDQYLAKKKLTVVYPGTQTRRFTHVSDTVLTCYKAWKKNKNMHYSISSNKAYSVIQIAKFFSDKIVYLKSRPGERFESKSLKSIRGIKIKNLQSKIDIKDYITDFLKDNPQAHFTKSKFKDN
jgi:UDP-glucose 4-epimerase